ncbi:ABC transporter ATP-binding protein [Staphylococcus massiliensis CCUG 55927]|uniref:ABC transporter ATP-binding protein n=1 Tax=Staphylococcus massiliensis TaxID=555791 RepID=UPI00031CC756|nr:ABC transporter ATP-binding protein [Staphylococcus massiliensis]PNZ97447.1 ABC transporter ATP-binding protein [Staphylococcus massiliensis CCUG 55927]
MIELTYVSKSFKDHEIFKNIHLKINKGDFVVLRGKSGQGKSTLLNIMSLLEPPTQGQVSYYDSPIKTASQIRKLKRKDIAYVYQNYGLLENKTVFENLLLPLNISKKDTPKIKQALQDVGLSQDLLHRKVFTCSGGEQQRVAIARAILKNPSIIFADEPTGNLDEKNAKDIVELFIVLIAKGVTIVMATHSERFFDIGTRLIDLDSFA